MGWLHCYLTLGLGLGHVALQLVHVWSQTAPRLCKHTFRENLEHLEAALHRASIQHKIVLVVHNRVVYGLYAGLQRVGWLEARTLDRVAGKLRFQHGSGAARCTFSGGLPCAPTPALHSINTLKWTLESPWASEILNRLIEIILQTEAHLQRAKQIAK